MNDCSWPRTDPLEIWNNECERVAHDRKATIPGRLLFASSDLGSFCHLQGVFDFDSKIPDGAFQLTVSE